MKDKLLNILKDNKLAAVVETKEGNFYEGVTIENSFNEEIINAIIMAISNSVLNNEEITAIYFMSKKEYKLPIEVKEAILQLVPRSALFNKIEINGQMKVYTYEEILKEK